MYDDDYAVIPERSTYGTLVVGCYADGYDDDDEAHIQRQHSAG